MGSDPLVIIPVRVPWTLINLHIRISTCRVSKKVLPATLHVRVQEGNKTVARED